MLLQARRRNPTCILDASNHSHLALLVMAALLALCCCTQPASSSSVISVTTNNFKELVDFASGPVLVEFYSPYCGHCISFSPIYERIAATLSSLAPCAKVPPL